MVSPLDHKLLRDLWRMKGQASAIGLVIALGVMMHVMMSGLVTSLDETRRAYYERYRLADVFASATRAPDHLKADLGRIQGVGNVETRVIGSALIDLPDLDVPLLAQAISLPDLERPLLNEVFLTDGRALNPSRSDEIILLKSFAQAHNLSPGNDLIATMNGAQHKFRIVGLAQSPEFLYTTPPGELVPDDSRFGVIWMGRKALATAYDLDGAFNEILLSLGRNANESAVLQAVDQILEPYGGTGAYGLADQLSNRFVSEEISSLEASSKVVPPTFLAVAAFLLYIVIGRIIQAERGSIGLLKAFGYHNREVISHYLKFVLCVAVGGALFGSLAGIAAGRAMVELYLAYFKFPFLVFRLDPSSFVLGTVVSVAAASFGGLIVLRRVFSLTPATAMSPPAPADYSRTGKVGAALNRYLDQPSRMVMRRLTRQPFQMGGAIIGIAFGMALSAAMLNIYVGFDRTVDLSFNVVDRSDVNVTFTHGLSDRTIYDLGQIPGVTYVEPVRYVAVILRNGLLSHRGAISGLEPDARLSRAIHASGAPIDLNQEGIVLASALAKILEVDVGDMLTVDVREGRQPLLEIPIVGIADTLLGSPAFMNRAALNRAMGEPNYVSGAYLLIDQAHAAAIYRTLKDRPTIAGVSLKNDTRESMVTLMDTGAGAMRFVMGAIAFVITFGIVYNAARIAYAERSRDLASLRVIGFTKGETAFVLLGEIAVVTAVALPLGALLGYFLSKLIAEGFSNELYQIPTVFDPASYGFAALVVIIATVFSGLIVKRDIDRADLVSVLKTRE